MAVKGSQDSAQAQDPVLAAGQGVELTHNTGNLNQNLSLPLPTTPTSSSNGPTITNASGSSTANVESDQSPIHIVYQGCPGAFSHLSLLEYGELIGRMPWAKPGRTILAIGLETFSDCWQAIEQGFV